MIKWNGKKTDVLLEGEQMYILEIKNEQDEIMDRNVTKTEYNSLFDVTITKPILEKYRAVDDIWTEEDSEYYGWWIESDYNLEPEICP